MAYRKKLSSRRSKKMFTRNAKRTHRKNSPRGRMDRGGIRL